MLAVSGAFPLTSDQPPLAVVSAKALAALMPGWDRILPTRTTTAQGAAPQTRLETDPAPTGPKPDLIHNPFAIAGPPPSFEANVLEIERQFDAILARLELARAQRELRIGAQGAEIPAMDLEAAASPRAGAAHEVKGRPDPAQADGRAELQAWGNLKVDFAQRTAEGAATAELEDAFA